MDYLVGFLLGLLAGWFAHLWLIKTGLRRLRRLGWKFTPPTTGDR